MRQPARALNRAYWYFIAEVAYSDSRSAARGITILIAFKTKVYVLHAGDFSFGTGFVRYMINNNVT
jgi:hypothetical protein